MKAIVPSPFLRQVLRADAAVSLAVAVPQVLGASALQAPLDLPGALLAGSGVFLFGYAALLLVMARSRTVWLPLLALVIAGNVGWAAACAALPALDLASGAFGKLYLLAQAVAVLAFAWLEYVGVRRSAPAALHA